MHSGVLLPLSCSVSQCPFQEAAHKVLDANHQRTAYACSSDILCMCLLNQDCLKQFVLVFSNNNIVTF